jgi:hypothetical protein
MKTFIIEITETLQKQIQVEAESKDDAMSIIRNQYKKEDIILDESDYVNTQFEILLD